MRLFRFLVSLLFVLGLLGFSFPVRHADARGFGGGGFHGGGGFGGFH